METSDIQSHAPKYTHGLTARIAQRRENQTKKAFDTVDDVARSLEWAAKHNNLANICPNTKANCEDALCGGLIRSAIRNNVWPIPGPPYTGLTYNAVASRLRRLSITSLCLTSCAQEKDHDISLNINRKLVRIEAKHFLSPFMIELKKPRSSTTK